MAARRLVDYDPAWLDTLCLAGRTTWGRMSRARGGTPARPLRTSPLCIVPRPVAELWREGRQDEPEISADARAVREHLAARGASFFDEIREATGLLRTRLEPALAELVASGLGTSDGFAGVRALLTPSDRRPGGPESRSRRTMGPFRVEQAGRWTLCPASAASNSKDSIERRARALLRRYGVVCRRLLDRESLAPTWRELLGVLRRLEARGEIRGGRFIEGLSGEQYALPEAVGALRAARRAQPDGACFSLSAADPLNLLGVTLPGPRVASLAGNRLLFRNGLPIAVLEGGETRFLVDLDAAAQWEARNLLVRTRVPPAVRAYLGHRG
jgi:ATP-dependent Lhr-like helicase